MSLGFIPVIIAMLLSEFIAADMAVYIGAAIGVSFTLLYYFMHKPPALHFISLSSTIILTAFSIIAFVMGSQNEWPQHLLPLTLEMAIILPLLLLFLNRKRYSTRSYKNKDAQGLREQVRVTTFTLSCIRIFFGLITIHFAFITIGLIFTRSLDNSYMWFMLHIAPLLVFVFSIIIGQIEIRILRDVKAPEFVPVITPEGEVIGKVDKNLAEEYKNEHMNPIIRIAVVSHDMLFLAKRSMQRVIDKGKTDTPLETYLLFKEDINSGVERLLKEVFPQDWEGLKPEFSIKYKFKNEETDRIVYLFILDLGTEDKILCDPKFDGGKLWTFQQIEFNLDQNYFSEMFENEYDHLKLIIETRGIYRES
ncbi:hypothetical protein D0T87_04495 [Bacteroides sp. 51]|nr:hypothetical protein [Bacteroides sp. 51]